MGLKKSLKKLLIVSSFVSLSSPAFCSGISPEYSNPDDSLFKSFLGEMQTSQTSQTTNTLQVPVPKKENGINEENVLYLTVDDGPRESIEGILKALGTEDHATFFVLGSLLETERGFDLACKALKQGSQLGNHSYSHPHFSSLSFSFEDAKREIEKTDTLIDKAYQNVFGEGGEKKRDKVFRFPYGFDFVTEKWKPVLDNYLYEKGYRKIPLGLDTFDWEYYGNGRSIESVMSRVKMAEKGNIVLIHDYPSASQNIIPYYKQHGFKLKKLGE